VIRIGRENHVRHVLFLVALRHKIGELQVTSVINNDDHCFDICSISSIAMA
jgi:hypothetical protein